MKQKTLTVLAIIFFAFSLMTACGKENIEQPLSPSESQSHLPTASSVPDAQISSTAVPTETTMIETTTETTTSATEATTVVTTEATKATTPAPLTQAEVEALIEEQEVKVTSTKYVVQDTKYKSLYPDMLQVIITNNSEYDIKNLVVAFVAWDENNLPVLIQGKWDYDEEYVKEAKYDAINLVPGKSTGSDKGYSLDYRVDNIKKFKAIVVSYENFDGVVWENPYYDDWKNAYEGKKLEQ